MNPLPGSLPEVSPGRITQLTPSSMLQKWFLLFFAVILTACSHPNDSQPSPVEVDYRTELPLTLTYDTLNRTVTPTLSVVVNGVANDLIFDTGSSGLRILGGALKGASVEKEPKRLAYGYGSAISATYIKGQQASGTVSLGGLSSTGPIHLMLIDTVQRSLTDPGRPTLDSAVVKGQFRKLAGIFGVGLRHGPGSDVASPLAQLPGKHSYLIRFPRYSQPLGQLIINPTAADLTGFTFFSLTPGANLMPNGLNSWVDNQLNGIMTIDGRLVQAPTILDTGNPITQVFVPNLASYGPLAPGSLVMLGLGLPGSANASIDTTFRVTTQVAGKDRIVTNESIQEKAYLAYGTNFFFTFDVYYDQQGGRIGIRRK